ncbi:MAG: outer membrane lipoprotein carrier protein LolA [Ignavibacteriaceae bacterium]|nr:outer membrane lipoprotein carrier protein LolA [Ignavibacteriaceae bacterium]NUM61875.1 outer membrane lipoprotein carrier protein LolA [Ignavibacteriaceae bacterium]
MKSVITSIFFISVLFLSNSLGQANPQELLKNIQDKFNSINDLSADLAQSVNGKINLKGKVFYKKDNHLRFEFENNVIVSDGETSWNYSKKQNKVIISDYDSEGNKILSIRQLIYEYPEDCKLSMSEVDGIKTLELIPQDDTFTFNSIKLFVDSENLIIKVLIDDPATGNIQVNLSDIQINKGLADSYFQFSPPEGSQIIDLR